MTDPITGVPSNYRVPGGYAEILFAQGASGAGAGRREVILVMPKLSTGTWTANTVYEIKSENDAATGAGLGSPMHRAARKFRRANKTAKLWGLPYAETSGGVPAAATGTISITGPATASGVFTATVCGEACDASYVSGDTATVLGDAVAASINAKTHLPLTAANVTGTITLTAKLKGKSQGDGTTGTLRYRVEYTTGTGIAATTSGAALGLGVGVDGAEGSTTEAANLQTALAVIAASRKYYIVTQCWHSTEVGHVKTHVSSVSEPRPGLRCVGISAYTGTLATCQTLATGLNFERHAVAWQENSEHDPAELAANLAAVRQKNEERDSRASFDLYREPDWQILPAFAESDWPDTDDQNDAINDGITPIASDASGSYIVMSCTTRSKNSAGTVDDFRATESHRVSVSDEWVDEALTYHALTYGRKFLKNDELLSDGTVNTNQKLPRDTVTPSTYKPWIKQKLQKYADDGKLQEIDASKESLRSARDPNNSGRIQVGVDLHVIDIFHQATFRVAEVSSG